MINSTRFSLANRHNQARDYMLLLSINIWLALGQWLKPEIE